MLVCQLCGKNQATTHLTELEPDGSGHRELHLCAGCIASNELRLESGPPPIAEILAKKAVGDADEAAPAAGEAEAEGEPDPACPICGLTFAEFAANNRFGCTHDYTAFQARIDALLRRYHGGSQHVGRLPAARTAGAEGAGVRRAQLDAALREAVASEDYERAARLRDELRRLGAAPAGDPPGGSTP